MRTFCWACVLVSILALAVACGAQFRPGREVTPEELAKLLEQPGKVYFLDVREPSEIAQLGSVKGYVNIPVSQLQARFKEIPRDKVIVTLWSSGNRAAGAAAFLQSKGFNTLGSCGLETIRRRGGGKLIQKK